MRSLIALSVRKIERQNQEREREHAEWEERVKKERAAMRELVFMQLPVDSLFARHWTSRSKGAVG